MTRASSASGLEGRWQMIRGEFAGEPVPELVVAKTTLELSGARYSIHFDREIAEEGSFITGQTDGHLSLTFTSTVGINAGRTIPAIYQHVGDRLRICFGFGGIPPNRFATAASSQLYLATYRPTNS